MEVKEKDSVKMYRDFKVSEWKEKCYVLTDEERTQVEKDLKCGLDTELTRLVLKTFPSFAQEYFKRFDECSDLIEDPAFGYKLYLIKDAYLKAFVLKMRNPNITTVEIRKMFQSEISINEIFSTLRMPIDEIRKSSESLRNRNEYDTKFLYLTQYIDTKEAKKLGLKKASVFEFDAERGLQDDGYELRKKLDILNPCGRMLVSHLLGLYGLERKSIAEISKRIGITKNRLNQLYKVLFPSLDLTLGEFKNALGYVEKKYDFSEYREYRNKDYKKWDLFCETQRIMMGLAPLEQLVLSSLSNAEQQIYIAYKYIFKDPKKTMEYLVVDLNKVLSLGEKNSDEGPKKGGM